MEPRFGADFGAVRVHTDERAARLNRGLNARAFTLGGDVFFGRGQFNPDSGEGREFIAHEFTHTVQLGAAVQRSAAPAIAHAEPQVQRLGVGDALAFFAREANNIPGFRMLTVVLGLNPIDMSRVDRSAANVLRAAVEFFPGGALVTRALDAYGVFERVGAWVEQRLASLRLSGASIRAAIDAFLDSLNWRDIFHLGDVWNRAKRLLGDPVARLLSFVRGLGEGVLQLIKDAVLRPLAGLASQTRAWDLLCAVLGRNPITGDAVPRTAEMLIGGFMKLIGQQEVWENIKRGNAVARAWAWFQSALAALMGFVQQVPGLFFDALRSLTVEDLVLLPRAFAKVASSFATTVTLRVIQQVYTDPPDRARRRWTATIRPDREGRWNTYPLTVVDGVELHRALRARDPCLRAIAMTAFAVDERVTSALRDGVLGVLPKPMDACALVQQVRRVVS